MYLGRPCVGGRAGARASSSAIRPSSWRPRRHGAGRLHTQTALTEGSDTLCKAAATEQQTAPAEGAAEHTSTEQETTPYDWQRQWYPLAVASDLDTDRPHAVTVLGKDVVVWCDGAGEWHAFEDKCPHRGVPLSEGRLEAGTLQCSYHGWRWQGDGGCLAVPQALTPDKEVKAAGMPRACAKVFPTQVKDGLLFAWLNSGPAAYVESAMTPLVYHAQESNPDRIATPWVARDMPMRWEMLVENVSDPSHVPFSHHGVQGKRTNPTKPTFETVTQFSKEHYSIAGQFSEFRGNQSQQITDMQLPTAYKLLNMRATMNDDQKAELAALVDDAERQAYLAGLDTTDAVTINIHAVPVTRGQSRLFARFEFPGFVGSKMAGLIKKRPVWHDHLERLEVLDGDLVFLHRQSQHMIDGRLDERDYFLPTPADFPIRNLWKWMQKFSPEGVNYYPDVTLEADSGKILPREQLLDRYTQHVKGCKACSGALANVRKGIVATHVAMAVAFLALAVVLATAAPLHAAATAAPFASSPLKSLAAIVPFLIPTVLGVVAAVVRAKLQALERKFTYNDYVHAEK